MIDVIRFGSAARRFLWLDAVPYLLNGGHQLREPETHAFPQASPQGGGRRIPGRVLLAEANQWPGDEYFGDPNTGKILCHAFTSR